MSLWNQEAEALTLAAILRYPEEYLSINEARLVPQDFIGKENQRVMRAIAEISDARQELTIPAIVESLRQSGHESAIEYALRLTEQPASPAQARESAVIVKGLSANRSLANAGARIVEIAQESRTDYESAIIEAEKQLWRVKQALPPEEKGISA